jgi:hypothetical protein
MNDVFELIKQPRLGALQERRKNNRKACSIKADYMVQGRWHRGSIQNISEGGAYIRSFQSRTFSPGEGIFLVAQIRVLREQLRGKIAWVGPHGMGVEFQTAGLECRELKRNSMQHGWRSAVFPWRR